MVTCVSYIHYIRLWLLPPDINPPNIYWKCGISCLSCNLWIFPLLLLLLFRLACGINLHKKCVYDSTPFCYKLRQNHQDPSNIIASTHSHMAQSRSSTGRGTHTHSASGHYKNSSNVTVPHTFVFHKFIAPTQCDLCGRTVCHVNSF